jgi:hypothetical protein
MLILLILTVCRFFEITTNDITAIKSLTLFYLVGATNDFSFRESQLNFDLFKRENYVYLSRILVGHVILVHLNSYLRLFIERRKFF